MKNHYMYISLKWPYTVCDFLFVCCVITLYLAIFQLYMKGQSRSESIFWPFVWAHVIGNYGSLACRVFPDTDPDTQRGLKPPYHQRYTCTRSWFADSVTRTYDFWSQTLQATSCTLLRVKLYKNHLHTHITLGNHMSIKTTAKLLVCNIVFCYTLISFSLYNPYSYVRSSGHIKINVGSRAYKTDVGPLWRVWRHKQVDSKPICSELCQFIVRNLVNEDRCDGVRVNSH